MAGQNHAWQPPGLTLACFSQTSADLFWASWLGSTVWLGCFQLMACQATELRCGHDGPCMALYASQGHKQGGWGSALLQTSADLFWPGWLGSITWLGCFQLMACQAMELEVAHSEQGFTIYQILESTCFVCENFYLWMQQIWLRTQHW